MTIFDKDPDSRRPEILNRFGQNLGSRSTTRIVLFGVAILIGLLLIGNFLISVTRIEPATRALKSTWRAASAPPRRFLFAPGGLSSAR